MVLTGTVKKWVDDRGFGFITPDDGSEDIFFHATGLRTSNSRDDVRENEKVKY